MVRGQHNSVGPLRGHGSGGVLSTMDRLGMSTDLQVRLLPENEVEPWEGSVDDLTEDWNLLRTLGM